MHRIGSTCCMYIDQYVDHSTAVARLCIQNYLRNATVKHQKAAILGVLEGRFSSFCQVEIRRIHHK